VALDITDSVAKKTVKFDREITGSELIAAVKATCAARGKDFHEDKRYDDGWLHVVGQAGRSSKDGLLVTADKENPYIEPDKSYSSAVVLRHGSASQGTRTMERVTVEDEVQSVLDFAEDLDRTVRFGPEANAGLSRGPARGAESGTARTTLDDGARGGWGQGHSGGSYGQGFSRG
jgi:hypothetical protein